jgi:K+-sensing histidine kinase KdpD
MTDTPGNVLPAATERPAAVAFRWTNQMQSTPRSQSLGLMVAALSVAAITAVIFPLRQAVPAVSTGVVYLLGVLLVSSYWGLGWDYSPRLQARPPSTSST